MLLDELVRTAQTSFSRAHTPKLSSILSHFAASAMIGGVVAKSCNVYKAKSCFLQVPIHSDVLRYICCARSCNEALAEKDG